MSCLPFHAIGIDVGGTKIAAGIVSFPEGKISARQIVSTSPHRGGQAVLDDIVRLAEELAKIANTQGAKLGGIGLGLCELVDPEGHILSTHSIQLQKQSILEPLSHFAPVVLEADVRTAALAEAIFGAGRSLRIFLYVTIGTGISSCLMIEGRPFVGSHGATGTMASSSTETACERCGHVTRGTLEQKASGPALVTRFNEHRPGLARTGQDVLAAAGAGDAQALELVQSAGKAVGVTLGLLVNVLDPEAVIVGGGLGLAEGPYWESLVQSVRRVIYSDLHRTIPVVHATTGEDAGLIGAAAAAWKKFGSGPST
jgi:glucokinase